MPWLSWRTSPRRCIEDVRLFMNPKHWLTWPCSVVFIAVYNKCVILLSKLVTLNAAPCILTSFLYYYYYYYYSWVQQINHYHTKIAVKYVRSLPRMPKIETSSIGSESLYWPAFSYFYLVCPVKYRHRNFNNATAASFHLRTNSFIPNPAIRSRIL